MGELQKKIQMKQVNYAPNKGDHISWIFVYIVSIVGLPNE